MDFRRQWGLRDLPRGDVHLHQPSQRMVQAHRHCLGVFGKESFTGDAGVKRKREQSETADQENWKSCEVHGARFKSACRHVNAEDEDL
jgi:hypothetical protein